MRFLVFYQQPLNMPEMNDKAYRSLTLSWFKNSPLLDMIQQAQQMGFKLILTTDHGTINVKNPSKVIGNRDTSLNLRYKTGRSLTYERKDVLESKEPKELHLPTLNMSSSFIFAKSDLFFAYPNNYNHYVSYYREIHFFLGFLNFYGYYCVRII